ncbi:MAG: LLM class F420-dependent oxidoreductase [Acidimicrobiales bacterium]
MKHWVTYPIANSAANADLVSKEALTRFAQTAESAGFDGIGFTDHPAPTHKWLQSGGHDALDPFAALAFVAAVTERLRLIPNICVLPYRNPFIVAKSVATISALSGDRFVLAVGTGYLRGEYRALGVDPDERNDLFDEALEVLRGVWTTDDFAYEGRRFTAAGQTANPKPGRPVPVWIGGNGDRARQRVADVGDGWNPFAAPATLARTTRTPALETAADLAVMLEDLWRRVDAVGRDRTELDIAFTTAAGGPPSSDSFDGDAHLAALDELASLGVTWNGVSVAGDSLSQALETLERYGTVVIAADRAR